LLSRRFRPTRRPLWPAAEYRALQLFPAASALLVSDVGPLIPAFRERGIKVGRRFQNLPEWLRISIGTDEEMRVFVAVPPAALPSYPFRNG
jgi:hypothetical protein